MSGSNVDRAVAGRKGVASLPGPDAVRLPIETASLVLRALREGDASRVFRMSREEGMRTWLPSQVYASEQHAAAVLNTLISGYSRPGDPRLGPYVLGVQLKRAGELIGHVGFSPCPLLPEVEVGFAVESVHQGKGVATEAVRAACEWALDCFSLATIVGVAATANVASQRVLLNAGFAPRRIQAMAFQGAEQTVTVLALERRRAATGWAQDPCGAASRRPRSRATARPPGVSNSR